MKDLIFVFILLLLMIGRADARDLELKSTAGLYSVNIKLNRNPPIVGENKIEIKINDARGRMPNDATVLVNYYMPPMPRMAPMNYKIPAPKSGDHYKAMLNFIMAGPWVIAVKITDGGNMRTAKFHIDAR